MTIDQFLSSPEHQEFKRKSDQRFETVKISAPTNRSVYALLRNDVSSYMDN